MEGCFGKELILKDSAEQLEKKEKKGLQNLGCWKLQKETEREERRGDNGKWMEGKGKGTERMLMQVMMRSVLSIESRMMARMRVT